jgi:A/G-specific adenine glycosylase
VSDFAASLVAWQKRHGRRGLPWQGTRDPYRIWLSEVMLQQTQVATVLPYFERFVTRFADVAALASADENDVLRLWSGLGYYSRARNLHAAARRVVAEHGGSFPRDRRALEALPGVGRSTAAAIAAFAFGERAAILDGNVKRVLARHFAVAGWPGAPQVERELWTLAESLLPHAEIEAYTQALMDLGATLCRRRAPACALCPVRLTCRASAAGNVESYPAPRPRRAMPQRSTVMLVLVHEGEVLLERRPPRGVWGGLWCLPEAEDVNAAAAIASRFAGGIEPPRALPPVAHAFTHFALDIQPVLARAARRLPLVAEAALAWTPIAHAGDEALPAPVRRILGALNARLPAIAEDRAATRPAVASGERATAPRRTARR